MVIVYSVDYLVPGAFMFEYIYKKKIRRDVLSATILLRVSDVRLLPYRTVLAEQRAAGSGEKDDVQDERQQPERAHDDRRSVCRAQQSENGKPRLSGRHERVAISAGQPADVDAGSCETIIQMKQILIEDYMTGDWRRMEKKKINKNRSADNGFERIIV